MRTNRFTSWASARVVIASVAVAGVAVIAACSDGGVASNGVTGPSLKRVFVPPVLANAGTVRICVGASSPFGTYTFRNSGFVQGANGVTSETPADGIDYTITTDAGNPEKCKDVLVRVSVVDTTALSDNFSNVTATNNATPLNVAYSSTTCEVDAGGAATAPCGNPSTAYMNKFHGSKTIFNFTAVACSENCIGTPQFVVGDLASGLQLAAAIKGNKPSPTLNFWGSQWWKNNPTSLVSTNGWPAFKGYATTADNFCGGDWTSRVGNSPPPPATIGDVIIVIVTDQVLKSGPDYRGKIRQIITVAQDGGYGPNPGHDGNGPRVTTLCGDAR